MNNAKIVLDTCIVSYLMKGGPLAEACTARPGPFARHLLHHRRRDVLRRGEQKLGRNKATRAGNDAAQLCRDSL